MARNGASSVHCFVGGGCAFCHSPLLCGGFVHKRRRFTPLELSNTCLRHTSVCLSQCLKFNTSFCGLFLHFRPRVLRVYLRPSVFLQGVKEPLRRYAQTLVKVDPGVRAVLGMDSGTRETAAKK